MDSLGDSSSSIERSVLLVAPQPFFANRGTPLNVLAMVKVLSESGFHIHLLVYPFGDDVHLPNVTVHRSIRFPFVHSAPIGPSYQKFLLDMLLFCRALLLCFRKKFHLLHGIEEGAFIVGTLGVAFRRPYIFDVDSWMSDQMQTCGIPGAKYLVRFFKWLERFFLTRATLVITVCQALSDKVRAEAPQSTIFQIEDFPLGQSCVSREEEVKKLRSTLADVNEKILVYTGNLESYQGLDLLLEALAEGELSGYPDSSPPRLVLVGGNTRDIERLKSEAEKLGVLKRINFVGAKPVAEVGMYLAAADALVSPRKEGVNTPLKIYTYMQAGVPIVATRILSHTQVLSEANAFLADPTPRSLHEAILRILDPATTAIEERKKRASAARELVEVRYSFDAFRQSLLQAYNEVLTEEK